MFSMDQFDFESVMSRHLFEGSLLNQQSQAVNHNSSNSNSSNDYFLCDDDSITDGESFNSDQENNNNEIKEWVGNFEVIFIKKESGFMSKKTSGFNF